MISTPDGTAAHSLLCGDALSTPTDLPEMRLILTDPPFGTGKTQSQGGLSYKDSAYTGHTLDVLRRWSERLADDGTMAVLCDYRLAHRVITALRDLVFRGEIIWTFGLGRPRTSWWPNRHNNILTFTKTDTSGMFDASAVPRTPRRAISRGYPDDKPAGSVWDYTMSNNSKERVGYPNQKPLAILTPFVQAHTLPGDLVGDPFCGSGSTGVAALMAGRRFVGVDISEDAVEVSAMRLRGL